MAHDAKRIRQDELFLPAGSRWRRVPLIAAAIGLIALGLSFASRGADPARFYHAWLLAFLFWLSIVLGGFFLVLVHFAAKAAWGVVVRRLAETLAATAPLFVLLFIPILMGLHELYHWTDEEHLAHDVVLQGKAGWLNTSFFTWRAGFYLVTWSALAWWFLTTSRRQDRTGDERLTRRMIAVSGPAIIVFALTLTFAAFDWIMGLDPHWYSTIFGVYYFAGSLVGGFATLIVVAAALTSSGVLREVITVEHFHDLGKLLYAMMVFWAYIGFSQFFLIWYANLPEETSWYLVRTEGGWLNWTLALAIGHFGLPFFFLMSQHAKRRRGFLVFSALYMLLMHWLDVYWLVMPSLSRSGPSLAPVDLATTIGVGSVLLATFGLMLSRHALVPSRDPRLIESMGFENV